MAQGYESFAWNLGYGDSDLFNGLMIWDSSLYTVDTFYYPWLEKKLFQIMA